MAHRAAAAESCALRRCNRVAKVQRRPTGRAGRASGNLRPPVRRRVKSVMGTAEQKTASDVEIVRMTEHDLLEVVEIEEQSGLSRWGWAAYYAELQGGNRELMLVAKPLQAHVD